MPTVHQEAERHAAEAKQMLKSAFDLAVAGTRKKVAALVKDGLFAPASTDEILARSIPVQQAAAQFQAHQMGRLSMVFGPGGVPELSPDVSIAELLHYADRAAEVLAAAKAQLAAVKATR